MSTETLQALLNEVQDLQKQQTETLKELLSQVSPIRTKYKNLEEIQATHFNIFSILHKEHDEVKLHSRFISELLDPNAEHKQKDVFLKKFLTSIDELGKFMADEISQLGVRREHHHIDILIRSPQKAIIIENKISAEYGNEQLSRYREKMVEQGYSKENIKLVYLTLDGSEVGGESEEVKKEIINISYKEHITAWLRECIAEVALLPTMRETIHQYLQLVQKLTGQSLHREETMEIKDLFFNNADYAKAFAAAQGGFEEAKREVEQRFVNTVKEKLQAKKYAVERAINVYNTTKIQCFESKLFHRKDDHFCLWIERKTEGKGIKCLAYGFGFSEELSEEELSRFNEIIVAKLGKENEYFDDKWIWLKWLEPYNDKILEFFDKKALDAFAEERVEEITSSVETLKQAKEFKEYQWLV